MGGVFVSVSTQTEAAVSAHSNNQKQDYIWLKKYPENVDWYAHFQGEALPDLLDRTADEYGAHICSYFFGSKLTYRQIAALVNRAAKGLQEMGVKKGVHVGILLPNTPYFIVMYYAILKAGGTVVNYNPLYTVEELASQVKDSKTTIMVTMNVRALFPKLEALLETGVLERGIVCSLTKLLSRPKAMLLKLLRGRELVKLNASPQRSKIVVYEELLANDGRYQPVEIAPDNDIAVLQYTGGTTGTPKGTMLTHSNISINMQQCASWDPTIGSGTERVLAVLPFFHVFGMTTTMNLAIMKAAQIIMVPRFDIDMAMKLMRKTKPTMMPGVPTLFNAIRNWPKLKKSDMKYLRGGVSGGAPLPLELKRSFEESAGVNLIEGYGLSETAPVLTINPLHGPVKEGSIGLPIPNTIISLRSLDDPTQEVPIGEKGEICAAGPQVMKGYWNRPEETAAVFVGEFFRTGDVGIMDEDGFIYIVDRIKDLIICSGYNVYPRRIEEAIYQHNAVKEVTAIGIPDAYRGEAPKAFIALHEGKTATAADILSFLEAKLSKLEMPVQIEFRDELPKSMVGKLSKKELRET